MTTIGVHRNTYVTSYMYDFIALALAEMDRGAVDALMSEPAPRAVARRMSAADSLPLASDERSRYA